MAHFGYCFICDEKLDNGEETKLVKQKGINTFIAKSKNYQDNKWPMLEKVTEVKVHRNCAKNYGLGRKVKNTTHLPTPSTSHETDAFDFQSNCLLCGIGCHAGGKPWTLVKAQQQQQHIEKWINQRGDDDWTHQVKERINSISLVEVNARFHRACYKEFARKPSTTEPGTSKLSNLAEAHADVYRYMEESEDCQFLLSELMEKLQGFSVCAATFKQKLINRYGPDILLMEHKGRPTIVCFRNTGHQILVDSWYSKKATTEAEERQRVVRAAAEIIREDIRSTIYNTSSYPAPQELLSDVENDIPDTLKTFLDVVLLKGKKNRDNNVTTKRNSIAHSIISIARPRTFISSIQLATGVYLTRKFGSRLIIDVLNNLGFCSSYSTISLYEASAIMHCDKKISGDAFVQHVFDNADHNVCSVDGFSTFHNMGGICCVTPKSGVTNQGQIKKLTSIPKSQELASKMNVPIMYCDRMNGDKMGLKTIIFSDVLQGDLGHLDTLPTAYALHIVARTLDIEHVPSWRGFMETISQDLPYEVSQVHCLPFVNLPPSDRDTMNTVLHSATEKCFKLGQKTCFVTFDQPLYIKVREIVANDSTLVNTIVRLGGFHLLISFLGSIGVIMDGSGLKELLSSVYAGNTVDHMLTGHAFSRAIRGHLLVHSALGNIIIKHMNIIDDEDHQYVSQLLENFDVTSLTLENINDDAELKRIKLKILSSMEELKNVGRTPRLWLQYFHCITLVMQFIEAERLGNWKLHLQCIRDMLPFFHATGHLAYAKSAQIYLEDMLNLPNVMDPKEYDKFTNQGFFTIRRSDKKWAGIWSDMTVEQTLMRLMKMIGGLTHGRGVNKEGVVPRWILGMPVAHEVMEAFEGFCGVRAASGEQHTDWRPSSMKRDAEDYQKFAEWFTKHNPFTVSDADTLMSIADGTCAGEEVNCDRAIEIGMESMKTMVGVSAGEVKLKRSTRVKSIATAKRGILVNDELVAINTTLLFQRIAAVTRDDNLLATISLHHELAPFPLSLFDEQGLMRKGKKSELYNAFTSQSMDSINISQCKIIVDGGFLLHKIVWPLGSTYQEIFKLYVNYVIKNYGHNSIVVFDGYTETSGGVKSYERLRRARNNKSTEIIFEEEMTITANQSKFLSNDKNKERLINFLKSHFTRVGISVEQAFEDADCLIVTTAIDQLNHYEQVAVIGQDVDLLVLLIALTPPDKNIYYVKQGSGKVSHLVYSTEAHYDLRESILLSHAFTGCDTTSSIFLRGKKTFLNILKKKRNLQNDVVIFNKADSTREEITRAGEHLMMSLYGAGEDETSINSFRYNRFVQCTSRMKTEVRLAQLPPTAGATEEHTLRVYFQVQRWLGNSNLKPEDWGWQVKNEVLVPMMTRAPPAPESILKMIFCSCKGNCTNRCGCRKAGIKCSSICSGCHGNSCTNCIGVDLSSDSSSISDSQHSDDILINEFDSLINENLDEAHTSQPIDESFDNMNEVDSMIIDDDDSMAGDEPIAMKKPRFT